MRSKWLLMIVAAVVLVGLSGCATVIKPVPAQDLSPKLKSGALVQKTNNFEVILDTSTSMDEPYKWNHFAYTSPMRPRCWSTSSTWCGCSTTRFRTDEAHGGSARFCRQAGFSRHFDTKLWYGMSPWVRADLGSRSGR